jgi:hypothetical protein
MPTPKPKLSEQDQMMTTMVVKQGWRPEDYEYRTLDEFFPFYMSQHANRTCRRLHFVGTTLGMLLLGGAALGVAWALAGGRPLGPALGWAAGLLVAAHVVGYAFAWVGHFFFEHNKPATFKYPWLSYRGDYRMWWQILTGKIAW